MINKLRFIAPLRSVLALAIACVLVFAGGVSAGVEPPSSAHSPDGATLVRLKAMLVARGLLGDPAAPSGTQPVPPTGTEVDETVQTVTQTGRVMLRSRSWNENTGGATLHVELTSLPSGQTETSFWIFPHDRSGCLMSGLTLYDSQHRPIKSNFWSNTSGLQLAGGAQFPPDLYPDAVPAAAFLRTLDSPHTGASGILNLQVSPFSYIKQSIAVEDVENVSVPAGTFPAFKVSAQADVQTLMPSWPRFVLSMIKPFVPKNTFYFQAIAPHRFLKQEGTAFVGGPEITTQLERYYIAGARAQM